MSAGPRWTDEDLGFLADTMDRPAAWVAEQLGRSDTAVLLKRSRVRRGWSIQQEAWTEEDDEYLRETNLLTAGEVAPVLGRTEEAVATRRRRLQARGELVIPRKPYHVGNRPLLARTCLHCDVLLDARFFRRTGAQTWNPTCSRCVDARLVRKTEQVRDRAKSLAYAKKSLDALQEVSLRTADRKSYLWTSEDLSILEDPDLTILQKAQKCRRTYRGTASKLGALGLKSFAGLGEKYQGTWKISRPSEAA